MTSEFDMIRAALVKELSQQYDTGTGPDIDALALVMVATCNGIVRAAVDAALQDSRESLALYRASSCQ